VAVGVGVLSRFIDQGHLLELRPHPRESPSDSREPSASSIRPTGSAARSSSRISWSRSGPTRGPIPLGRGIHFIEGGEHVGVRATSPESTLQAPPRGAAIAAAASSREDDERIAGRRPETATAGTSRRARPVRPAASGGLLSTGRRSSRTASIPQKSREGLPANGPARRPPARRSVDRGPRAGSGDVVGNAIRRR